MKRDRCPSVIFARKFAENGNNGTLASLEKWSETKKVNFLDKYKEFMKEKENIENGSKAENREETLPDNFDDGKDNLPMEKDSSPIYFWAKIYPNAQFTKSEFFGIIEVSYDVVRVYNMQGKQATTAALSREEAKHDKQKVDVQNGRSRRPISLNNGRRVHIGSKFIEIGANFEEEEFVTGRCFLVTPEEVSKTIDAEEPKAKRPRFVLAAARRPTGKFVCPFKDSSRLPTVRKTPLFPIKSDSLVLYSPPIISGDKVAVVVDPKLSNCLRPHQRIGVQFMYDCVMGLKQSYRGTGCILADGMGLGKTIQAITLSWTLLRQGPAGIPAIRKCAIVTPSSLVGNWGKEIKKWLGDAAKVVTIADSGKASCRALTEISYGDADYLVISYDQLKIKVNDIKKIAGLDLIICDEGHKLKNANIKTSKAVDELPTKRRIVLSGTPIQNDLEEFHAMVSFVNPGVLGDISTFRRVYEGPILAARDPGLTMSAEDVQTRDLGRARSAELSRLTAEFILKRSSTINMKYLPPKTEFTIFCSLSPTQKQLYNMLVKRIGPDAVKDKDSEDKPKSDALQLITALKKLCSHPKLLQEMCLGSENLSFLSKEFPQDLSWDPILSGKLTFLLSLIEKVRSNSKEKIVIVSNYTQTLGALANLFKQRKYPFFQLDGKTTVMKRQALVDQFNDPKTPEFLFLLSSKAGGCGLNLVGGCHLVMFDPDWNPANDDQAMARVWRDGQKSSMVRIFRLLTAGTIEEKIYQRQISKLALSAQVMDKTEGELQFKPGELRQLFKLSDTQCETHDLLICRCTRGHPLQDILSGKTVLKPTSMRSHNGALKIEQLNNWDHFDSLTLHPDELVSHIGHPEAVTFLFSLLTKTKKDENDDDMPEESIVEEELFAGDINNGKESESLEVEFEEY